MIVSSSVVSPRPWVWLDVDDVLVDSTPIFQESMDRWTGKTIPWQTWTHNRFHQFYGIADEDAATIARMRQRWKDDRVLERSPFMPHVAQAMATIVNAGADIGLLTARAWHSEGEAITREMAAQAGLSIKAVISIHFHQTKADFLIHSGTQVVGFIDDTIRHVEGCVAAGFNAVLMDQPWNREARHLPRVANLEEFAQQIQARLASPVPPRRSPRP